MSSAASSSFQTILAAALDNYSNLTGIDLTKHASAEQFQNCHSPDDILRLLLERESAFADYRDKYRKLIDCLRPVVPVVHAISSILGEAAGLVPFQPTKVIFTGIDALLSAAIGISASYDALGDLFECVANFLRRLHIFTEKIPPSPAMSDLLVKIMVQVLNILAVATKQIQQGRFKKFAKKLLGESDVEAILQRLDRLTQEEAKMTATHTLEVVHGLFHNLKVVMDDGKASMTGIQKALVTLQDTADGINKIQRNQFQINVRSWLSPPDPSTNHNIARREHLEGTALWFTQSDRFREWIAMGSFLWIHGKPGSGKSILCSSIIHRVESLRETGLALMAYFYFDFRDSKKQGVTGLLASLVAQLSAKSDAFHDILFSLYSDYDAGSLRPDDDTLLGCLETMLKTKGQPIVYIIIDSLDECPNDFGVNSPREWVLELMNKLVELHLPNVRICATSRPEADIHAALASSASHTVSLHAEVGQRNDIANYVRSVVYSKREMQRWKEEDKELVISTLSQKADGMFRWVTCQLEALKRCFPSTICRALDHLPKGLDETYDRILKGIPQEKQEYAQCLLKCVAVSIRPLRVEELADVLAIEFEAVSFPQYHLDWRPENAEEEVLSVCSSLITIADIDGSQVVRFSHFSVKEYLTSERLANTGECLSQYHILSHSAHTSLAKASLSVLLALDDQADKDTMKKFPLAIYAARYWVDHAQLHGVSSTIKDAMGHLFDPENPYFATWAWIHDIDYPFRETMFDAHPLPPEGTPLYYATLCGFRDLVEHLIVTRPQDINTKGGYHYTPLHAAAFKENVEIMTLLLEHGADVAALNQDQCDPLYEASRRGCVDVIELLLDHHADVDSRTAFARTPLSRASLNGELEVVRVLLRHGATVDPRDKDGWTPLMLASRHGHADVVRLLLQNGAISEPYDNRRWTPLMVASYYGQLDVIRLLLENGATVDSCGNDGRTSLTAASQNGHLSVVRLLLENRATVDSCVNDGRTSLMLASQYGYLSVVRLLLENRATVDSRENYGRTSLMLASENGRLDVVRLLLENGAIVGPPHNDGQIPSSDLNLDGQSSCTALHLASTNGHLTVAELLIQYGTDVNLQNEDQETPLDLVSRHGKLTIARLLLASGSNVNSRDGNDSTPLHKAAQGGHLDVVKLLLESGADVNTRDSNDVTPLDLALQNGRSDVAKVLAGCMGIMHPQLPTDVTFSDAASQDSLPKVVQPSIGHGQDTASFDEGATLHTASEVGDVETVRSLLAGGADVNQRDANHRTPVIYACQGGWVEIAELLIKYGADVNSPDGTGWAPLHAASQLGHLGLVLLLLDHGADVDAKMQGHWTALHWASEWGHLEIVEALLKQGASVGVQNEDGRTPSQLAVRFGERKVAQLLLEYNMHEADHQ